MRAGGGGPKGVFAGAKGLPDALGYLAELDLPFGAAPGVKADGLVRGATWAAFRVPERPALGEAARAPSVAICEARLHELAGALPRLADETNAAPEAARIFRSAVDARAARPDFRSQVERARAEQEAAESEHEEAEQRIDDLGPELGTLAKELEQKRYSKAIALKPDLGARQLARASPADIRAAIARGFGTA